MNELATALEGMAKGNVFVSVEGHKSKKIVLIGSNKRIEVELSSERRQLAEQIGELDYYINRPKMLVIGWDLKNLFSHVRLILKSDYELESNLLDLKILESFLGIHEKAPISFKNAQSRLALVVEDESWGKLKHIYKKIHLPLLTSVMPRMENVGVVHTKKRLKLTSCYEILGQVNGRSKCSIVTESNFNPHSLVPSEKESIRPSGFDEMFMHFDFNHQEVSVLQWLSKDPVLGEILKTGKDLYQEIWRDITKLEPNASSRKICKSFFLPVFFGQGAKSLSERVGVPIDVSRKLIKKIRDRYSVAMEYVESQSVENDGFARDYYGKKRFFGKDSYLIRNFAIQSPASTICLDKLVKLHKGLIDARLAMHIHDGYVLYSRSSDCRKIYNLAREIMESDDDSLYPNLKLKISCEVGNNLNELKSI
jgi:DNA polymerase I-like protein with 3'-5' exonuclease and polymerase domains